MNAAAPETPPLPLETREGAAPVKDRMTTTLFLAALFHGIVILGVTFAVPMLDKQPAPSIEVLLVTGEDTRAADNLGAQYLAQRNQQGSGTTDEHVRPSNPGVVGNRRSAGRHCRRQQQRISRSGRRQAVG